MSNDVAQPITLQQELTEMERELAQRERLYPKWIEKGQLKPSVAAYRIAVLKSAIDRHKTLEQPNLI